MQSSPIRQNVYGLDMKLFAISDLHLHYEENRNAVSAIGNYPDDWLILGGDIGERGADLRYVLDIVTKRFAKIFWVPGNHELWTLPKNEEEGKGEAKYQHLVSICREYGVHTPEDPYVLWTGDGPQTIIAPLFNLYDYSFRPDHVPTDKALSWAREEGLLCNDEVLLQPEPHANITAWCEDRLKYSEQRLEEAQAEHPEAGFVLINHFPLLHEHVRLWRIPRFSIWCGTRKTADWHTRFPVRAVVYGHLHMRSTDYADGVRFEEVSLGYPRHWNQSKSIDNYLREIIPGNSSKIMSKLAHWMP